MALVPNRPAQLRRRIVTYSLATDFVAAALIGLIIGHSLGLIVFVIGLIITGVIYYNFTQVMRTRGYR